VLEWRVDPASGYANPYITSLDCRIVLFCAQGFSSSLAAASLRELGCVRATDMIGGFEAWKTAGLPVRPLIERRHPSPGELMGMGPPEPYETMETSG
jgi:3-mercaptopyruvate sulfurtransferase SseA